MVTIIEGRDGYLAVAKGPLTRSHKVLVWVEGDTTTTLATFGSNAKAAQFQIFTGAPSV